MISNDETTGLQLALDRGEFDTFSQLLEPHSGAELTTLQLFGNHSLLMYALERCPTDIIQRLLDKGVEAHELEWSDNNELKSALRNEDHRNQILPLVLKLIPQDILANMITGDWNPDPDTAGDFQSPLDMSKSYADDSCHKILRKTLEGLG